VRIRFFLWARVLRLVVFLCLNKVCLFTHLCSPAPDFLRPVAHTLTQKLLASQKNGSYFLLKTGWFEPWMLIY
jgi:hypothetical protein